MLSGQCYLCSDDLISSGLSRCLCDACIADLPLSLRYCPYCAELLSAGDRDCHLSPIGSAEVDLFISQYHYENPVSYLIKQLKYKNSLLLAHFFGESLARYIQKTNQPLPDGIIAIPMHARRLRSRGYNQALEIAKVVASLLGIPLLASTLVRSRYTLPQTECSSSERGDNLKDSFAVKGLVSGMDITLVDDVLTTGATLREGARALKAAGANKVYAWSCAQAGSL